MRNLRRNLARFIRKRKNRRKQPKMLRHTDTELAHLMNFWLLRKEVRSQNSGTSAEGK